LNAVKYATKLAAGLSSNDTITLINVHDDTALRHASQYVGKSGVDDYLRDLSREELAPAKRLLEATSVKHDEAILTGHISESIVKYADSGQYDMIVLGSKGRSGITDLLVGSVAQRVLATAKQPVLLVK